MYCHYYCIAKELLINSAISCIYRSLFNSIKVLLYFVSSMSVIYCHFTQTFLSFHLSIAKIAVIDVNCQLPIASNLIYENVQSAEGNVPSLLSNELSLTSVDICLTYFSPKCIKMMAFIRAYIPPVSILYCSFEDSKWNTFQKQS